MPAVRHPRHSTWKRIGGQARRLNAGFAALLVLTCIAPALAQSTQPAPAAPPVDTPKDALSRLSSALHDGDVSTIIALIDAPAAPQAKVAAAMARFDGSLAELHSAAVDAFGEDKAAAVVGDTGAAAQQSAAAIDSAQVKIDGDHATVTYADPNQPPARLVHEDGLWRVHLKELDAVTDDDAEASAQQFDELTIAARKLAEEIRQQKFKNADKAAEAWHNRMMQAVSDTQPATQPGP
jgi:hypothetical protein